MSEIQSTRHAPTFTAITTFMPPQQSPSGVASALAPLDSLAGLAGGAAGISSPGERYVALMQSVRAQLARTEQATDALGAASGISKNAHLYATEFPRASVRITQQLNYERPLREFETQVRSAAATRRTSTSEQAMALTSTSAANSPLIEPLRSLKPTAPIVLQMTPLSDALPEMVPEYGDRLSIPARPTMTGVFGSLFSTGGYLHSQSRTVGDYLRLAGGPTRGSDQASIFVILANGAVSSSLLDSSFFARGNQVANLGAELGDTIFVPEEMNKAALKQITKDWTQILYQFGLGVAGIRTALK